MNHIDALLLVHLGRDKFCTLQEFEEIAGHEHVQKVLEEFGSWERACEYLKNHWNLDLEAPFVMRSVPKHIADILHDFRRISQPTDFSQIPYAKDALIACLKNFHDMFGFVPTIDEAKTKYADYFPNVYHYIETFGTWHNACKRLSDVKPEQIPDFGKELRTTVNYYNSKYGRTPGQLMLKRDWDDMVRRLGKEKAVPYSSQIIDYVSVDRESRGTGLPQNGWQAVAEEARLNAERRGRPQELARLHDRTKILNNFVGACVKNGCILTLQGWRVHCVSTNRGYRPPDAKTIKELFGGMGELQMKAAQKMQANKKLLEKFMTMKEIAQTKKEIAAADFGTPREKNIWDAVMNLPKEGSEPKDEIERDRFIQ